MRTADQLNYRVELPEPLFCNRCKRFTANQYRAAKAASVGTVTDYLVNEGLIICTNYLNDEALKANDI